MGSHDIVTIMPSVYSVLLPRPPHRFVLYAFSPLPVSQEPVLEELFFALWILVRFGKESRAKGMSRENMFYLNFLSAGFHRLSICLSWKVTVLIKQTFPCNPFSLNGGDSTLPLNLVADHAEWVMLVPDCYKSQGIYFPLFVSLP